MSNENLIEAFENNSSQLYWLAYLLTGNTDRGVQAFDRALDFDDTANPVFGEFMIAWARKLIVVEALRGIQKDLRTSILRVARVAGDEVPPDLRWTSRPHIEKEQFEEAVIAIDAFSRCAMLLTIFEGLSSRAAALLLGADEALTRKAQQIGIVRLTARLSGGRDSNSGRGRIPVPVLSLS